MEDKDLQRLYEQAISGAMSRRQVLKRAAALGLSAPAIAALLAACGSSSKSTPTTASASTATSSQRWWFVNTVGDIGVVWVDRDQRVDRNPGGERRWPRQG